MEFLSKWITTAEFLALEPIDVFHKELDGRTIVPGPVQNYHVHFRKGIFLEKAQQVILHISADDYYKLYINGTFVCQGPAPAYPDSYHYNRVDITSYLKEGENTFAVHVYYQGLINRVWNSGDNRQGVVADIFADGKYVGGTDATWLYKEAEEYSGETVGYATQFLENIDFCKKDRDWKLQAASLEGYRPAVVKDRDDHVFREEPAESLEVYRVYPKECVKLGAGKWFLDFGTELTGQLYLKVRGEAGQKVELFCGEEPDPEDVHRARYRMRCYCDYHETCTLSGEEDELELFDYKAFRYANIETDRDNLDPDTFCAIVRHHKFVEKCRLESDIPWLEKIWQLCVNSLKWGVQEGYLDCPSREKGQYLGDFTVSGLAHMYVTGDWKMYRKTLYDFAATTKVCKGILSVAPGSFMQEIADFSLQYPMQIMNYYRYTGDEVTLRELYPVARGILEYFVRYEREDGLLVGVDEKWNLVDWPQNLRDGYELEGEEHGPRPCHNVVNAHYIGALETLKEMEQVLGIAGEGEKEGSNIGRRSVAQRKEVFRKAFYIEETGLFRDNLTSDHSALHSNVLPVFYGIAPEASLESIKAFIMKKGFSCGTHFSYFVLKALGKMGAYREELALLTGEGEHSWVNMLKEGATTCFEAWGKDQKSNTSLCHPWSCSPIIVLIEDILKVDPAQFAEGQVTVLKYMMEK